ncbi:MAG TPA: HEAT repeat domain-containing protein, partial [Tepidisphaeraceae bacterium]|nr:HEAT repeat domain-containing protein [Tepidisphaeraceae bacterium]
WHDGYMTASELAAWLDGHAKPSGTGAGAELTSSGAPDAAALDRIIEQLPDRDPLVHEAAVRRLMPYPDEAAPKVVTAFASGDLRLRLAAGELLVAWKAPVDALDPWRPETFTPAALDALKQWAGRKHAPPPAEALSSQDLEIARHDLTAMLQTTDPTEVNSARERLARFGPALLPELYRALKSAATDQDRERLAALRYRVVATEALALQWPGGFDRLASTDAQERRQALAELGSHVTANDSPLLMELFSDPDEYVRETSLRLLQSIGGEGIPRGLVRLLHDPEPNVRAAVLKQLAETPDPQMVPQVVQYVAAEKDPDLIVYCIRFLREAGGKQAIDCLLSLLNHPSWRVRAEAAEGLGVIIGRNSVPSAQPQAAQADIYAAMIKLLDDPDGFVVSRALGVLKNAQVPSAIKAVAKVADRRPELAPEVVKTLGQQSNDATAQAVLRRFLSHKDPGVRAASLTALGTNATTDEVLSALRDSEPRVRMAAATIVDELLEQRRPDAGTGAARQDVGDWDEWLKNFRSGKGRPAWVAAMIEPLRAMLHSNNTHEKLVAALPLVALGDDTEAERYLHQSAASQPAEWRTIGSALRWLPWDQRIKLFNELKSSNKGNAQIIGVLAIDLAGTPSIKAADALWELLNDPAADISVVSEVNMALMKAYTGQEYWFAGMGQAPNPGINSLIERSKRMAAGGSANQRLAALALLLSTSLDDASSSAAALLDSGKGGQGLQTAALQVLLLSQPRADGVKTAIAHLGGSPSVRKVSLAYLAAGGAPIRTIQGELFLNYNNPGIEFRTFGAGAPVVIEPPAGATPELLRPLLKDSDPETVAYADYLLCLLGQRQGLDDVIRWWQRHRDDEVWRRLAYRAISVNGDDNLTPMLEEIYATYDKQNPYEIRDFYWTIRVMKGDKILKLRKRIRDEVGMEQLR